MCLTPSEMRPPAYLGSGHHALHLYLLCLPLGVDWDHLRWVTVRIGASTGDSRTRQSVGRGVLTLGFSMVPNHDLHTGQDAVSLRECIHLKGRYRRGGGVEGVLGQEVRIYRSHRGTGKKDMPEGASEIPRSGPQRGIYP